MNRENLEKLLAEIVEHLLNCSEKPPSFQWYNNYTSLDVSIRCSCDKEFKVPHRYFADIKEEERAVLDVLVRELSDPKSIERFIKEAKEKIENEERDALDLNNRLEYKHKCKDPISLLEIE